MQNSSSRDSYQEYVVQKGDSLYTIAKKYNTTVNDLNDYNMLTSNVIYPGQVILVPKKGEHIYFVIDIYVVEENDTLHKIARKTNIDVQNLANYNDVGNLVLQKGQTINIPRERTYVVDSSDTVESVLRKTNRTAEELLIANASSWLKSGSRIAS